MIYALIDILLYNFTPYHPFLFLLNINNKTFIHLLAIGLFLDILVLHTYGFITLFLVLNFLFKKYILKVNMQNILIYYLYNLVILFIFFVLSNFIFGYIDLTILGKTLVLNSIFILLSYKISPPFIKLIG